MAGTMSSFYNNYGRFKIEGSFDLSAAAAVQTLTYPAGGTKTVRGRGMSVVKTGTGTYTVTCQTSNTVGGPVINLTEFVDGDAGLVAATLGGVFGVRLGGIPTLDTNGNISIPLVTTNAAGANTDTTAAITVVFNATFVMFRMDNVL